MRSLESDRDRLSRSLGFARDRLFHHQSHHLRHRRQEIPDRRIVLLLLDVVLHLHLRVGQRQLKIVSAPKLPERARGWHQRRGRLRRIRRFSRLIIRLHNQISAATISAFHRGRLAATPKERMSRGDRRRRLREKEKVRARIGRGKDMGRRVMVGKSDKLL